MCSVRQSISQNKATFKIYWENREPPITSIVYSLGSEAVVDIPEAVYATAQGSVE